LINIWHQHFAQLPSTQLELRANLALYQQKAQAVLLSATAQTGGIGQYGHHWQTNHNALAFSCTILPAWVPPTALPLSIIWGIILLKFLQQIGKSDLQLKWPNDLVLRDHKCGGILIEKQAECFICGIGLNWGRILPHEPTTFAALDNYIPLPAGPIFDHDLTEQDYAQWPAKIYAFALEYFQNHAADLTDPHATALQQIAWWRQGTSVKMALPEHKIITGTFEGVTPDGAAIIDGHKIYSGNLLNDQ
jgi:BirA family biotin operon repressor/biotin-[acetyl-CoA-carboxylase] ligase